MPRSKNPRSKQERKVVEVLATRSTKDLREWRASMGKALRSFIQEESKDFFGSLGEIAGEDLILYAVGWSDGQYLTIADKEKRTLKSQHGVMVPDEDYDIAWTGKTMENLTIELESSRMEKLIDQIIGTGNVDDDDLDDDEDEDEEDDDLTYQD